VTFTAVGEFTGAAGLAELEVWGTAPDPLPAPEPEPLPALTGTNVADEATVTASSENTENGQYAANVADGVADGYPGDHTTEWATLGEGVGAWIELTWSGPAELNGVVLHDRVNEWDNVTGALITFDDGSTVTVPALQATGAGVQVSFPTRTTTSLRVTFTAVGEFTGAAGLAELEVWGTAPDPLPAPAPESLPTSSPLPASRPASPTSEDSTPSDVSATPPPSGDGQPAADATDAVLDGPPDEPDTE
jgi:hypothetical protein